MRERCEGGTIQPGDSRRDFKNMVEGMNMILVDIYVPGVNQTYDFSLDETARISLLLEEISGMICQKEQCELKGSVKELLLVSQNKKKILNSDLTLSHYHIGQGDRLMLV